MILSFNMLKQIIFIIILSSCIYAQTSVYEGSQFEINVPIGAVVPTDIFPVEGTPYIKNEWAFAAMPSIYLNHTIAKSTWSIRWGTLLFSSAHHYSFRIPRGNFDALIDQNLLNLEDGFYDPPPNKDRYFQDYNWYLDIGISKRFPLKNDWGLIANISFPFRVFGLIVGENRTVTDNVLDTNGISTPILITDRLGHASAGEFGMRPSFLIHKVLSKHLIFQTGFSAYFHFLPTFGGLYMFKNLTSPNSGDASIGMPVHLELNIGFLIKAY